jgi:hypothetical protein
MAARGPIDDLFLLHVAVKLTAAPLDQEEEGRQVTFLPELGGRVECVLVEVVSELDDGLLANAIEVVHVVIDPSVHRLDLFLAELLEIGLRHAQQVGLLGHHDQCGCSGLISSQRQLSEIAASVVLVHLMEFGDGGAIGHEVQLFLIVEQEECLLFGR